MKMYKNVVLCLIFFVECAFASLDYKFIEKVTYCNQEIIQIFEEAINDFEENVGTELHAYYLNLKKLIKAYDLKSGCEIGISLPKLRETLFNDLTIEKFYNVEPYFRNETFYSLPLSNQVLSEMVLKLLKKINKNELNEDRILTSVLDVMYYKNKTNETFKDRFTQIRLFSLYAIDLFENDSLDFCSLGYVLTHDATQENLVKWYKKVRTGGIIAGTTFGLNPESVNQIKNFFKNLNIELNFDQYNQNFWWAIKL